MEKYLKQRSKCLQQLQSNKYKGLKFTELELQANELFKKLIFKERDLHDDLFYKVHTLKHIEYITQKSELYQAILKLPKGAVLHIHIDCCNDIEWFMKEIAFLDTSYYNEETQCFKYIKVGEEIEKGYKSLKQERDKSQNKQEYEEKIKSILIVQEADRISKHNIWKLFEGKIIGINQIIYYEENFKRYLKQYLTNFAQQGVFHIEARSLLGSIFNENHQPLNIDQEVKLIQDVITQVQKEFPLFTFKIIIQGLKMWDTSQIEKYMESAINAKKQYPDLFCGFDMVQEEDAYKNMVEMAPALLKFPQMCKKAKVQLPFVFHGGESLEHHKNSNILDAVMMGSKRIGHGLNLSQHSYLYNKIKDKKICIEICPVSNQILKYIDDIRCHPIKSFINYGIKVCINPDDPGFFGYNGVAMDFYFCAVGPVLDYKDLKLCAFNSVEYSLLNKKEKKNLWSDLERRFQEWSQWMINTYK
ncbi:hypothetical protein IMG5_068440 [Ichthyophthirius multifiliis]|uniref:adenosine deaminase n=1 Tax=Ichthyophthirius multifiliis TaxID=5932 RepID=G0QPI8_ICHMU|nr:hypothetical protein IMG5_068440 [Ichthyophthirius multifiliis]EGR32867.1 hypothetical protein IMG5_068440 [Ichthyophthirius multifiliis]|eukprot:XP_004036853.1 hypothetical protein IMG5_068440 [Ichthyophthirius multifiliis]